MEHSKSSGWTLSQERSLFVLHFRERRSPMYVVFAEELEDVADVRSHTVATLEQAFAQIVCRCGYAYHFEQEQEGWKLVLVDVERPACNPEPVVSTYKRPRDAKNDLIAQAVD